MHLLIPLLTLSLLVFIENTGYSEKCNAYLHHQVDSYDVYNVIKSCSATYPIMHCTQCLANTTDKAWGYCPHSHQCRPPPPPLLDCVTYYSSVQLTPAHSLYCPRLMSLATRYVHLLPHWPAPGHWSQPHGHCITQG